MNALYVLWMPTMYCVCPLCTVNCEWLMPMSLCTVNALYVLWMTHAHYECPLCTVNTVNALYVLWIVAAVLLAWPLSSYYVLRMPIMLVDDRLEIYGDEEVEYTGASCLSCLNCSVYICMVVAKASRGRQVFSKLSSLSPYIVAA